MEMVWLDFDLLLKVLFSDKDLSDEIFFGSFTNFGSRCVKACVIQYGRRCFDVGD